MAFISRLNSPGLNDPAYNTDDVKNKEKARIELAKSSGSVFTVGNNSYSGADIKVVVHSYGPDSSIQNEIEAIQKELIMTDVELVNIAEEIAKSQRIIDLSPVGTNRYIYRTTIINRLKEQERGLKNTLASLSKRLAALNKQQIMSTKVLAEIQTLSLSIFRDKQSVRSFGSVYPKSFTRGPREIAGTAIFTVFDEHVLYSFLQAHIADFDASVGATTVLLDQLPPVDITISFANEYGSVSRMAILGVEFIDEGQTMSIEDLLTENVVSFVARDLDPMRGVSQRKLDENSRLMNQTTGKRASDLLLEEDYKEIKESLSPFRRFRYRRNPFV